MSFGWKIYLVSLGRLVKMYLAEAASFPPCFLVPNCPIGASKLILLLPQKFYAKLTIVDAREASP